MEEHLGEKISEGKTKVIYKSTVNDNHVIIVSKDSISAGNGAKKDVLPGKGKFSTITTANVFRLLQLSSIPTHFVGQISSDTFRALKCSMIPLEVIVRRIATGSYLKRFPDIKEGTRFETPLVEFTFKDDVLGDPLITDEEIVARNLVIGNLKVDKQIVDDLRKLAEKSFLILESTWKALDVALVDFKVEFGVTQDGKVILADVIDNDSWRIWPKGDKQLMKDKQVYRNLVGQLTEVEKQKLIDNYAWAAEKSAYLLDSLLKQVSSSSPLVGVIMGSQSDWETMKNATDTLHKLGVSFEARIVSAHRTPERLFAYAKSAKSRGLKVIIAGAGGAAHLPGMVASMTTIPVLGVPIQSRALNGMDSLLSIVQMPGGIPVGTLAIGTAGAINAALLATSIVSSSGLFPEIEKALEKYRGDQTENVSEFPVDAESKTSQSSTNVVQTLSKHVEINAQRDFPLHLIPPGKVIGVVGGGQLAKMIAQAATQLGYRVHIFCPDKKSPAFQACDGKTIADYKDKKSLALFAGSVDVVTYEFENIPSETLDYLSQWVPVRPKKEILEICQNRIKEKTFVNSIGIPTTRFEIVENLDQLKSAINKIGYPAILKTNTMGYDGKGQIMIKNGDNVESVWRVMTEKMNCDSAILEAFVDFDREVSVIVCRGFDGQKCTFPVGENKHSNHILKETIIPATISESTRKEAENAALAIGEGINLVGILAVEMFVTKEGKILVNELAPRPHNSGHWTIEGCETSQFEQLVRTICGLPLGSTKTRAKNCKMLNLLGKEIEEWKHYLELPNTHLHNYGKIGALDGRKMGHVTILSD